MDALLKQRIENIKQNVSIWEVLDMFDVENARDVDRHIYCPFHFETKPSFKVYQSEDGILSFYCFSCQKGGDVLRLYQLLKQRDVPTFTRGHTILELEKLFHLEVPTKTVDLYSTAFANAFANFNLNSQDNAEKQLQVLFLTTQAYASDIISKLRVEMELDPEKLQHYVWRKLDSIMKEDLPVQIKTQNMVVFADSVLQIARQCV